MRTCLMKISGRDLKSSSQEIKEQRGFLRKSPKKIHLFRHEKREAKANMEFRYPHVIPLNSIKG